MSRITHSTTTVAPNSITLHARQKISNVLLYCLGEMRLGDDEKCDEQDNDMRDGERP